MTSPSEVPEISREQIIRNALDVFAILEARFNEDDEGVLALWQTCDQIGFAATALGLLVETLDELGIDVNEWIARHRADLIAELAAGEA